ncbi:hypothetical protein GGI21_006262 [Coemansia aciculifera]|nr:hypothetical protein GGI21_006262 [Coemansia aciculifera]
MDRIPSGFSKRSSVSVAPRERQPRMQEEGRGDSSKSVLSKKPVPIASTDGSSGVGASSLTSMTTKTFWCEEPGRGMLVVFKDSWILKLTSRGELEAGEITDRSVVGAWNVVVPGICPFHIIAQRGKDDSAVCGGIYQHIHDAVEDMRPGCIYSVTSDSLVLNQPLVTTSMPMHALLLSPELRRVSLFYYNDGTFSGSYPDVYTNLQGK